MIHPIVKYGDPVLETPAKTIEKFDEEIEKLVADMFESMYAASGVGLAAPQIGIGLRIAVIDVSNGKNAEAKLVCASRTEWLTQENQLGRLQISNLSRQRIA